MSFYLATQPAPAGAARTRVRIKALKAAGISAMAGQPAGSAVMPAWDAGAGAGSRQSVWLASASGINTAVIGHAATLRNRARDQVRRNPWARKILDQFVANAIGTGIKPQSRHRDRAVRELLHAAWLDWTDAADLEEVSDFYGLQALAVRAEFESGECFLRLHPRPLGARGAEDAVPLQLQLLEADHVPLAENRLAENGNVIVAGIEFTPEGRRAAYWMYREHPGEFLGVRPRGWELERVPASEILHLYVRLRPGQVRGVPRLASVLTRLFQLDQYEDFELARKGVSALFAGFVSSGLGDPEYPLHDLENVKELWANFQLPTLEPGLMAKLPPGGKIDFAQPAEVGNSYEPFLKWNLRAAAAGGGVTYEQATGDLSDVNFSSIRAGLIEFRRTLEQYQHNTPVYQLNRPVWREWLELAALAGVIPVGDYLAETAQFRRVAWIPQGWPWVDPEKEQRAAVREVRAGFTSRARVVSGKGEDVEEIDREIAEDKARADELGLVLDSDPSVVSQSGTTQAKPAGSEIPDAEAAQLPAEDEGEGESEGEREREDEEERAA